MLDTVEPDYLFKLEYDSSSMKVCCWSTLMVSYWGEKIVVPEEVFNRAESLVQVVLHWLVHVHQGCYIIRLFQIDLNLYHYKIGLSCNHCVYNGSIQTLISKKLHFSWTCCLKRTPWSTRALENTNACNFSTHCKHCKYSYFYHFCPFIFKTGWTVKYSELLTWCMCRRFFSNLISILISFNMRIRNMRNQIQGAAHLVHVQKFSKNLISIFIWFNMKIWNMNNEI